MRRILLFAAFLLLLGLTTATAASFDVEAEDITSFSTAVSISVPTTTTTTTSTTTTTTVPPVDSTKPWYLFRAPPAPGGLSTDPEAGGPHKADVRVSTEPLIDQSDATKYYVWSSGPLPDALRFESQSVTLLLYLTAGGRQVEAALLDCPAGAPLASSACAIVVAGTTTSWAGVRTTVAFGKVTAVLASGRELRLKVVNRDSKTWTVEWGFGSARDSNLTIGSPSP